MFADSDGPRTRPRKVTLQATADEMAACLERVRVDDAAAVQVLDDEGRGILRTAFRDLPYRRARPVIGTGERRVTQDFDICDTLPQGNFGWTVAAALGDLVNTAQARMAAAPCPPVTFDDLVVQRYDPGPCGISPHRDHIRYINLIGVLVIDGAGDFAICDDRQGHGARPIPAAEGSLLLMRGPGFDGRRDRPFHTLGRVTRERLILGLRQDARPDAGTG